MFIRKVSASSRNRRFRCIIHLILVLFTTPIFAYPTRIQPDTLAVPTATLASDTVTHCIGTPDTLQFTFTGVAPFSFIYTINGVKQAPLVAIDTVFLLPVNPVLSDTTFYALDSVGSNGSSGTVSGHYAIVTLGIPTIDSLKLNCTLAQGPGGTYKVEFDVVGGTQPFTLDTGVGTFTGDHFKSANIPSTKGYYFAFHDANNCDTVIVSGYNSCFCTTYAGTMAHVDSLTGCLGTPVSAKHNGDQVLEPDDVFMFVLHSDPGLTLGTIIQTNYTEPTFDFDPATMIIGQNYWISAIAGNNDGMGGADPNDDCFSMTPGIPVHWHVLPTMIMDTTLNACAGDLVAIPVELSGSVPRVFTYTQNGQPTTITTPANEYIIYATVTENTTFLPVLIQDIDCPNVSSDTALVIIHEAPQPVQINTACNPGSPVYILEFDVQHVDLASVQISGSVTGNYNPLTGHFTSDPIPIADPYTVILSDGLQCASDTITGVANCSCGTFSGTMSTDPIEACTGGAIDAAQQEDAVLDQNDILVYILHTSSGTAPGTILATKNTPTFDFIPGLMTPDTQYFISAVAGNDDGAGLVDWNDPCLSVSPGTPVIWHQAPTAVMDAALDICPGDPASVTVRLNGAAPFTFTYTLDGQVQTQTSNQDSLLINVGVSQSALLQSVSVSDAYCSGPASGTATVTVHQVPELGNVAISCHPDNLFYTLELDVTNGDLASTTIAGTITGSYDPAKGHFTSTPIPITDPYMLTANDSWQCGQASVSGVSGCSCATAAGIMDQTPFELCSGEEVSASPATGMVMDANDTLVYLLVSSPDPDSWAMLGESATPVFTFNPATMLAGVKYYIAAAAGNNMGDEINLEDPCLSIAIGPAVVWKEPATAQISGDATVCAGEPALLTVEFTGDGPYEFVYTANGVGQMPQTAAASPYSFEITPIESATYGLKSLVADGCSGDVSGTAIVPVNPLPQIVNDSTICNLTDFTYTLQFSISNGSGANPVYTVVGINGVLNNSTFVSDPIPSGQAYSITVVTPGGCSSLPISGAVTCQCATSAGSISAAGTTDICLPGSVSVAPDNNAVLDGNDMLQYIMYSDMQNPLSAILASSNSTQFDFLPGMKTEQIYYVAAIAGNTTPDGSIDLTDPCLSVSPGIPVVFHNPPTAVIDGDTTVCAGSNVKFRINFSGKAPFNFTYAINGNNQAPVSTPQNSFNISTNNVLQEQTFTLVAVQDAYCTGSVSGIAQVHIQPAPAGSIREDKSICPGDTALLTLDLQGGTAYDITVQGGTQQITLSGVQNGAVFPVAPGTTTTYFIKNIVVLGNSCPAVTGAPATVTVALPAPVDVQISEFGSYQTSCPDAADGFIEIKPAAGTILNANWSTGATTLRIDHLPEGAYNVILVDANGCSQGQSFVLQAPPALIVKSSAESPHCAGDQNGQIRIEEIQGGSGPFLVFLNDQPGLSAQALPLSIDHLASGKYTLNIADANGCETAVQVSIDEPAPLNINLGADTTIVFGDSMWLEGIASTTVLDTFSWSPWAGILSPEALRTSVRPTQTTLYTLWVRDANGCTASDAILVQVSQKRRVYIPNVIKTDANSENGFFTVYGGPEVQAIRFLKVYNRWGECMFEGSGITPNQPGQGWSGHYQNGDPAGPGVYVYAIEVEFFDGTTEIYSGELTVLR